MLPKLALSDDSRCYHQSEAMDQFNGDSNRWHIERLNCASREEIQDLITLPREQRIDIMALFAANNDLRETFQSTSNPAGWPRVSQMQNFRSTPPG